VAGVWHVFDSVLEPLSKTQKCESLWGIWVSLFWHEYICFLSPHNQLQRRTTNTRKAQPYLVTFFRFETVASGKDVLHPLQKHLLWTQESSKLRTLHSINQTSSIHAYIRGAFRWLWINGGNFSIQNLGASRAVFSSVNLVDLGTINTGSKDPTKFWYEQRQYKHYTSISPMGTWGNTIG
jgi:hypothetical protein